ncbi:asparagine synthase (glutamine-hydrolyzing) [Burkholderia sp. Ac-20379]|uniref:asparagine synthase (glutamine-hydrolyzing) n=1 Tax=Burkholderia sp. Ac-20379 TaxID=2703900 RepID=UPI00198232D8|nr:asparagine synthase (glutamine-hydrolyzing) [Burkholderia sp. Ac-20379]MBN3725608.1 asparagine synthase (glutamine-hydrolyzing) [Burkholderia sp. Ac-20379]
MCGIAGFLSIDAHPEHAPDTMRRMLAAIAHRGPDGSGYVIDDRLAMGTARLSIIDVKAGTQPISDPGGRYWLCYNGEIYNYRELRAQLEARGCVFHTRSDTEVVLQAWIQWGEGCLEKFNGGFAFALYDRATQELVLARDRYGKRPLFYARHGSQLLFASEMKAFLAVPGFAFEQDPAQISAILGQWTPLPDQTGFAGIHSLPMGEWLRVGLRGELASRRYDTLDFAGGAPIASEADAIERIRQALTDSVALRLRSDVEVGVGVYLSGGLDSAIVALLAGQQTGQTLSTFSVEFEDAQFDESPEQQTVAGFLGTRHSSVRVTHGDIVRHFPDAAFHAEVPAFRSAFVPMYLLARHTREAGIKVILSGEGADEAFLGYDLFKETQLRAAWNTLDETQRGTQLGRLYPHLDHYGPQDVAALTGLYGQFAEEQLPGLFSHELRFQNGRFSTRLLNAPGDPFAAIGALCAREPAYAAMTPVQKAQWLEFKTLLPGYLLSTQGERMSLAHGVENRCPFLDKQVIDLAASVNLRFDDGFEEKRLLRMAFRDSLPASVVEKRKFPYRAPESAAFAAHRPDYLEMLLADAELAKLPWLNAKFARALTNKVLTKPAAEISTKENQTFIFLLSMACLNHAFVQRAQALPASARTASPLVRAVDLRGAAATAQAAYGSQGNFDSVT